MNKEPKMIEMVPVRHSPHLWQCKDLENGPIVHHIFGFDFITIEMFNRFVANVAAHNLSFTFRSNDQKPVVDISDNASDHRSNTSEFSYLEKNRGFTISSINILPQEDGEHWQAHVWVIIDGPIVYKRRWSVNRPGLSLLMDLIKSKTACGKLFVLIEDLEPLVHEEPRFDAATFDEEQHH